MSTLKHTDRLLDLRSLSEYSSLSVPTLRDYLRSGGLPHFKLKGKILVRVWEFDEWIESFRVDSKQKLDTMVNDVMNSLKQC
jgi:predicted DNA-binding transcriptional regulator AlpA